MQRADIEKTVCRMYDARIANDATSCTQCFTDDAQLALLGEDDKVYQSEMQAPLKVDQQIKALVDAWDWQKVEDRRIIIEGNRVAVMYRLTTVFKPTGEQINTMISDHLVINDSGKIEQFMGFVDTAMVRRLVDSIEAPGR